MIIAGLVIAHGRALRHLLRILQRQAQDAVFRPCRGIEKLDGIQRLPDIAAASLRDMAGHTRLRQDGHAVARFEIIERPLDRALRFFLLHGLELKDRGARQNGVIDIEIRVFRRGRDQRDLAVFDVFQQRLLLLFVEILDLVEIQQHAVRREERVQLGVDLLNVGGGRRGCVELAQLPLCFLRDQVRDRCLARAGRPVEDEIRHASGFDDTAQQAVFAQNMLLPADV